MVLDMAKLEPLLGMTGDLPPSSSVTGTRLALAAFITALPTGVEPVNTRWSKGSAKNAAPISTKRTAGDDGHLLLREDLVAVLGSEQPVLGQQGSVDRDRRLALRPAPRR